VADHEQAFGFSVMGNHCKSGPEARPEIAPTVRLGERHLEIEFQGPADRSYAQDFIRPFVPVRRTSALIDRNRRPRSYDRGYYLSAPPGL
jgi:hypothetical protein